MSASLATPPQPDEAAEAAARRALAELVANGDLDRLVALARTFGGAADALSDDIVGRLAETATNALVLIDRVTRTGLADRLVGLADQWERSNLITDLLTALDRASADQAAGAKPAGGLSGLWQLLRRPETQAALGFGVAVLEHLRALRAVKR